MVSVQRATIDGFNEFIEGQKATPGEANVTLIQFDTDNPWEVVFEARPIKSVPKLTDEVFKPRGGTPLHDAVGATITDLGHKLKGMGEADRPGKVVIVIMTDGLENSSTKYKAAQIAEMIKHQREVYKWEFIFLGANQDAILTGEQIGIPMAAAISYAATAAGTANVLRATSSNVASYRSGASGQSVPSFTTSQRKLAMDEEDDLLVPKQRK
jgi:hypothetical protein